MIWLPMVGAYMTVAIVKNKLLPPAPSSSRPEAPQTYYQRYPGTVCVHEVVATDCRHCCKFAEE